MTFLSLAVLAGILFGAATVVLLAVAAAGLGPLSSLRRAIGRTAELREEGERLRRSLEVLQQRTDRLRR